MLQATINEQQFEINFNQKELSINNAQHEFDIVFTENGRFLNLIYRNQSFNFEILQINKTEKTVSIEHQGHVHQIQIKDKFDLLLKNLGLDITTKPKINDIKAPMPGLVLSILIKENQVVKKGDHLLILEAMKMENIIKSPIDGVVKNIPIQEKHAVDKNQTLINFI
ncbi:MAG: biotin/lipoyl-containing protein [Bacteroidota bacterium]|nr:biotin/lipoyl-containing protein [Bacteroidota bacterium]